MQRRFTRALLAAIFFCTIVVPLVGSSAGPKEELQSTEQELSEIREQIERHETEASNLRRSIDYRNRLLTRLQIVMNELAADIADVRSEVRTAQARIDATRAETRAIKHRATEQAVALYKTGGTETLAALLDSESLSELNDRIEMLGIAAEENTGALIRYGRLRALIKEQARDLFAKEAELEAKLEIQRENQAELDAQRDRLAAQYEEINGKLAHEHENEARLEAAARDIKDEILGAQVGTELASLGRSSEGFIWPVNGSVVSPFGERWGRLHAGVDIDAVSGQAIAAAKSGVIIYQSAGMSGYGNTIIIDHGGGISTLYAHQSSFAGKSGSVGQGEIIGYVGCTGSCTGDHLHFEVRVNGNPTDPMGYLP